MMDAQAQDRAHRIGQKNEVRVFRLLTNSVIEERILSRANDKKNLNGLVVEAGKFNSRSSSTLEESKEMMEALLREWSSGGVESQNDISGNIDDFDSSAADADVPDDDQLNEMMACYDGELLMYQEMDSQFKRRTDVQPLMGANELPTWLTESNWPSKYRQLMIGMMTISEPEKKRGRKRDSTALATPKADEEGSVFSEEPIYNTETSLRKRKEVVYDDGLTDFQFQRLLEQEQDAKMKQAQQQKQTKKEVPEVNMDLIKAIQEIQKLHRSDGSLLAGLFLEKPSKHYYPDYYSLIEEPISLKEIIQKLRQGKYEYFEEIELDFALMSHNARIYNTDQSPVFHCSEEIRREFYAKASKCLQKHGLIDEVLECPELPASNHFIHANDPSNFLIALQAVTLSIVIPKSKKRRREI
jgi:ATP-dependent helicase STH1/SNF2